MQPRTWEDNAAEFGALSKQGKDFRLALLVACSAFKGKATDKINSTNIQLIKVTAETFAASAGTSRQRVLTHLDAWDRIAADGIVPPAANMTPENAIDFLIADEMVEAFDEGYVPVGGGRPRDSKPEVVGVILDRRGATDVVDTLTDDQKDRLHNALVADTMARMRAEAPPNPRPLPRPEDTKDTMMDAVQALGKANALMDYALGIFAARGVSEEFGEALREKAAQLHVIAEVMIGVSTGGVSDAALAAFIGGEGS